MNLTLTRPDGYPLPSDGRGLGVRAFFYWKFMAPCRRADFQCEIQNSNDEHEGGVRLGRGSLWTRCG